MGLGRGEQCEPWLRPRNRHGESRHSGRWRKQIKHRSERRRVSRDVECAPGYKVYAGWEY